MNERELYKQKKQAQLDEWKADIDKLRARASRKNADVQLKLIEQIKNLESRLEDGKKKLAGLGGAGEDAWDSLKNGLESAWESLKSAVSEASAKFKD